MTGLKPPQDPASAAGSSSVTQRLDVVEESLFYDFPSETPTKLLFEWTPPSRAPFQVLTWGSTNSPAGHGTDHVVAMGWNAGMFAPVDNGTASEPALFMGFEDGWWDGVNQGAEWYIAYYSPDHSSIELFRPFYARVLRDNNTQHSATIFCDIGTTDNGTFNVSAGDFTPIFTVSGTRETGVFATLRADDANCSFIIDGDNFGPFFQFKFNGAVSWNMNTPNVNQLTFGDKNSRNQVVFTQGSSSATAISDFNSIVRSDSSVVVGKAAIATDATDGFLYVPTCAGAPTGTPTSYTGTVPLVFDTTNHRLYVREGGAWHYFAETA